MADHLFFPTEFLHLSPFSAGRVLGQRAAAAALHTVHVDASSAVAAQARTGGSQEPEVPVVAADILTIRKP